MQAYTDASGVVQSRIWCSRTATDAYVAVIHYAIDVERLPWKEVMYADRKASVLA